MQQREAAMASNGKVGKGALAKALIVTAEVMGFELSELAAEDMARELAQYPAKAVAAALQRCKRELSGRLTLAAILARIDDGHPGAEEAWAIASKAQREESTIVWTDEICEAHAVARSLLEQGDAVGARMAFRETYTGLLQEARDARRAPNWTVSMGTAKEADPIIAAVEKGRLSADYARRLVHPGLPDFDRFDRRLRAVEKLPELPAANEQGLEEIAGLASEIGRRVP